MMQHTYDQRHTILGKQGYLNDHGQGQCFLSPHENHAFPASPVQFKPGDKKKRAKQKHDMKQANNQKNQGNHARVVEDHGAGL